MDEGHRKIGIMGVQCFDGPCNPWTKMGCVSCGIRPMKVYTGNDGKLSAIRICNENGWGMFHSAKYDARPYQYHALDNGAFQAWVTGRIWDPEPFIDALTKYEEKGPALDFVVVPDIVAGGLESLKFSIGWLDRLDTKSRKYLAVQDGMTENDILPIIKRFGGLFVGGTLDWKYMTSKTWTDIAHRSGLPCHIGRVGVWDKIVWASRIGADSIDSTSWARNNSYHHLIRAKEQTILAEEK